MTTNENTASPGQTCPGYSTDAEVMAMDMDERTLQSLQGAVQKWRQIASGIRSDGGWVDCPLCIQFLHGIPKCAGCPVAEKTGKHVCLGTPYESYVRIKRDLRHTQDVLVRKALLRELEAHALAELDFLQSLLPEHSKT